MTVVVGELQGCKLESFPWDRQKQIGKFKSLQVQTEYGFFGDVLKLGTGMFMSSFEKIILFFEIKYISLQTTISRKI